MLESFFCSLGVDHSTGPTFNNSQTTNNIGHTTYNNSPRPNNSHYNYNNKTPRPVNDGGVGVGVV
jgi:hypothetical protein